MDVKGGRDSGPQKVGAGLAIVNKAGFPQEGIGADQACNQRTDDQQGRGTPAGDEIVIKFFDPAARVVSHGNVNDETDYNRDGIDIHSLCFLSRAGSRAV